MVLSLILGGAFASLLLMFALARPASAASDDPLVSSVSVQTTIAPAASTSDSSTGTAKATVSGDGAKVAADSLAGSAQATVSGDGAKVAADSLPGSAEATASGDGAKISAESPAGSAQATVSGDGARVSADSPAGSADLSIGADANTPPELDVSVGPGISPIEPTTPNGGALADPSASRTNIDPSRSTAQLDGSSESLTFAQEIPEFVTRGSSRPWGLPAEPGSPMAPEGRTGIAPAPSSSEDHGPSGTWNWLILIVLFTPLWYLLTARSRMPHGVGGVLALPG